MWRPTRRAVTLAPLTALAAPALARGRPRLFALIVGINGYLHVGRLFGCVNDARLLEATVRPIAHRLTVLLEGQATRGAFLRAWDAMAAEATPGDTILITFSGHGAQQPEMRRGNEADGLDEILVFHAFHRQQQPNNAERVIDDELGERFARTGARGIRSIFLADCCHAGTLTRSIDPRVGAVTHRSAGLQTIENDMLAGLDIAAAEPAGQSNLLFIAAGQENQLVPELLIEGRRHGATSVAFARAFERGLAAGRFPSTDAFAREVIAATRARAEGRHHPLAENRLPADEPLLPLSGAVGPSPAPPRPDALRLFVLPGTGPLAEAVAALPGVTRVNDRSVADALLDPARAELIAAAGDVLAVGLDPASLVGAVAKLAALRLVEARGLPAMEVGLVPQGAPLAPGGANSRDERHAPGAVFDLVIRPPRPAPLVVVSLAADGTVRLLSTRESAAAPVAELRRGVRVTPPPGAAHVLALALSGPSAPLHDALSPLDRSRAPREAVRMLLDAEEPIALARFGFYVG